MKKILAIWGMPGAGKDTFCDFFKKHHPEAVVFKFSDSLSEALNLFVDEIKRKDQQALVNFLRDYFGEDILTKAIKKKVKNSNADIILLNGARVWGDYNMIKSIGGINVYIKTDSKTRWSRMKDRGEKKDDNVSYEEFLELDKGRSEKDIKEIAKKAEITVENNSDLKSFEENILKLIKEIDEK